MATIYKHPQSKFYQCDVWVAGRKFSRSTKCTSRREAETKAREIEQELSGRARAEAVIGSSLALEAVGVRYMEEVRGRGLKRAADMLTMIEYLVGYFGPGKLITEITHEDVAGLISKRRADLVPHTTRRIAPATVNATVLQLVKLFNYCRRRRVVFPVEPTWRDLWLKVAGERERLVGRELREADAKRLDANLRPDYVPIVDFALLTGKRQSECVNLRWSNVNWEAGHCEWIGKGGRLVRVALTERVRELLWPLQGHHPEAVFTYVSQVTRKTSSAGEARVAGKRYPITVEGLRQVWWDLQRAAGLQHIRFHDLRHTAATRVLRKTGNLKLAARMLDHTSTKMVDKCYGHLTDSEVGCAMDDAARRRNHRSDHRSGPLRLVKTHKKSA